MPGDTGGDAAGQEQLRAVGLGGRTRTPAPAPAGIGRIFWAESGRSVAALIRIFGQIKIAEDAVQDALAVALGSWPRDGLPPNPGGWITTTARRLAIDRLRRDSRGRELLRDLAVLEDLEDPERGKAHDLTIHRWDAQNAGGATQPILAERATDFIDELFERALPYIVPFIGRVTPNSSLALRPTDRHFARLVHGDSGRPRLSHKSGPADATLTGTCSDLLLAVWSRPNAAVVTGNPAVLTDWQRAVDG